MAKDPRAVVRQIKRDVKIVDLADEHGISLTRISSGNFTHRCTCPNPNHKMGNENTDSLYIDEVNNNYYCYGCSSNNSCIDFYMICNNLNFSEAVSILSEYIDFDNAEQNSGIGVDNFMQKLEVSRMVFEFCQSNKSKYKDFAKLSIKLDEIFDDIKPNDYKKILSLKRKMKQYLKRRYNK